MASENGRIIVYCDGGCRNNPGAAAWAYVVQFPDGRKVTDCGFIKYASNNAAEYRALYEAATFLRGEIPFHGQHVEFRSDSQLCVKQLNGEWRVKEESLRPIYNQALAAIVKLQEHVGDNVDIVWIPRSQNVEADALCGQVQDEHGVVGRPNPKKISY